MRFGSWPWQKHTHYGTFALSTRRAFSTQYLTRVVYILLISLLDCLIISSLCVRMTRNRKIVSGYFVFVMRLSFVFSPETASVGGTPTASGGTSAQHDIQSVWLVTVTTKHGGRRARTRAGCRVRGGGRKLRQIIVFIIFPNDQKYHCA